MNRIDRPGGVILGSDFQALGVVRSLCEHDIPVYVVEYEQGIARFSRHVNRRIRKDDLFTAPDGAQFLLDLARRQELNGWVLYPNSDDAVKFLSQNRAALSQTYRVPVPVWETTQQFFCKDQGYRLAAECGIPIPRQYPSGSLEELLDCDHEFPLVLKPSFKENYYEKTQKKAIRVENRDELAQQYRQMAALIPASQIVVQEMIPGGPSNLYSFATVFGQGRMLAGMSARRSRQHPMDFGHATTFAESIDMPQLAELATRFLQELGYEGIAEMEFMYDSRCDCYKFIEMNGRIWGWHTLARAAGVNLALALHQLMTTGTVASTTAEPNIKWVRLITDTPTAAGEVWRGRLKLRDWLGSIRGRKEFAVFSISDPLPFLMEYILSPWLWWKKGF